MTAKEDCVVCGSPTRVDRLPVRVRRDGVEVLRLMVPMQVCEECGWQTVEDSVTQEVIERLEAMTEPGDEIVFPNDDVVH